MNTCVKTVLVIGAVIIALFSTTAVRLLISSTFHLSPSLEAWKNRGDYFMYQSHPIFYIDTNPGSSTSETLLLLHGYPTSSHDFHKILPDLTSRFRVIMFDYLGYGFSAKPFPHEYSTQEQASIAELLMHRLQVQKFHVLAHDYGVTVAQELVARFNDNSINLEIQSVALMNGGVFPEASRPLLIQRLTINPVLGPIISHFMNYFLFKWNVLKTFGTYTPTEEGLNDLIYF